MSQQVGLAAEEAVRTYLSKQGLKFLTKNFRCKLGEIDLIMRDGQCLVFVEVPARASAGYGGALASVTKSKQQKLIKTTMYFLKQYKFNYKYPIRFDVVSLEGTPYEINWVKNAFGSDF